MTEARNPWLLAGGLASLAAALAHLACIWGGPGWYRMLGAPPAYVRAAARGAWTPAVVAAGIAALLAVCAVYAFSGAGFIGRMPLLRAGLIAIAAVYLARGMAIVMPSLLRRPDLSPGFLLGSSAVVLAMGVAHAIGLWRGWNEL